jgi:hypothetical protein
VENRAALRRAARDLGPDLVVRLPHGDSAADFRAHAEAIAAAPEVKVMRRIRCRTLRRLPFGTVGVFVLGITVIPALDSTTYDIPMSGTTTSTNLNF